VRGMQVLRSSGIAAIALSLLVGATGAASAAAPRPVAPATATRPAFVPYNYWGWVNVTTTASGLYTPAAINRGNSTGRRNTVFHAGPGVYVITMRGLANFGGTVQLTSIGSPNRFCRSSYWSPSDADELVYVECFNSASLHADATFTAQFLYTNYESHRFAYLWADNPSADYDLTSVDDSAFSFNSAGGPNHVTRTGTGHYAVILPGLGVAKGDVQVTPYHEGAVTSASPAGITFTDCKVAGWSPSGSDELIYVYCFDVNGDPSDSQFNLIFTERAGLKGPGGGPFAYLLAQKPSTASYSPKAAYRYSSAGHAPSITRQGTGKYTVTLPGMPAGGTVKVTAYGTNATRCTIKSFVTSGSPQKVRVSCWTLTGTAIDSKFTLSYEK
jgi:hypothetical protein